MSIVAGIGSAITGLYSANAQRQTAGKALNQQEAQFNQVKADAQPFLNSANTALGNLTPDTQQEQTAYNNLQDPSKTFQTSPGYNFELGQGEQAVQGSSALNGLLNSGSAVKALNNYAQGQADQQYNTYVGQLQNQFSDTSNMYGQQESTAQGLGATGLNSMASAANGSSQAISQNANALSNVASSQANSTNSLIGNLSANPQVSSSLNGLLTSAMNSMNGGTGGSSYGGGNAMTGTQTYTI